MDPVDDDKIYPILAELSACLCKALEGQAPCFCGIVVGGEIPVEYAGDCHSCGAAYVRLINSFPSLEFPEQSASATCATLMAYTVGVGIVRCTPVGDDDGAPPTPEEMDDLARLVLSDMKKIRDTIRCCLGGDTFEDIEYVVGAYTPLSGGVTGGEQVVTIRELF